MENENNNQPSEAAVEQTDIQTQENTQVETQPESTNQEADTTEEKSSEREVGLVRKEEEDSSGEPFDESSVEELVMTAIEEGLSEEQRKILDESGLGKYFDMIVGAKKAEIAKNDEEIISIVGDKQSYSELQEWALSNLNDDEIDAYNRAVLESHDIGIAKLAVEGLQARYLKANGQAPSKVIEAGGTSNEASRPYASRDDYIKDALSIEYKRNPEYAAQVEAKRNLSGF